MMPKTRSFQYRERTRDDVKARANNRGGGFDGIVASKYKMYKVKDGKNVIRILPPTWDKATHYGYDIWVNYSVGVDNQSYLSLSKMKNERDPLAEARRAAEDDGDKKLSKALQPRQRILMWIIDRMDEDEGPQLWAAPFTVDKDFANISLDPDTGEVTMVDHPEHGCDIQFVKEGQMLKTDYPASKMRLKKPSRLHEDERIEDDWLQFVQDNQIPDCLQFYDYDHINGVFNGQAGRNDDDEDDKPRGRDRGRAASVDEDRPRRRPAVADDDENDDAPPPRSRVRERAPEPEPEDEIDEKPVARTRPRAVEPDPEPDDEPEVNEKPAGGSIRERLARRKAPVEVDDD